MKRTGFLVVGLILFGCSQSAKNGGHEPRQVPVPTNYSTEVGAGGSGVHCPGYFEVTDVYEARKRGMNPTLGAPSLSVAEKIKIALSRLAKISPKRAATYAERANFFLEKASFFKKGSLPHIADEDPQDLGEGCYLETIATRRKPIFKDDPEFLVNQSLWDKLDNDNRAALALHEVVYEEAFKDFGHRTSRFSRALVSLFFSNAVEKMGHREFISFLNTIEFSRTDLDGISIVTSVRSDEDQKTGTTFSDDGSTVVSMELNQDIHFPLPLREYSYQGNKIYLGGGYGPGFVFKNGRLELVHGQVYSEKPVEDRGNILVIGTVDNSVTFFENGLFRLISVREGSQLRMQDGSLKKLGAWSCVTLRSDGVVESIVSSGCDYSSALDAKLPVPQRLFRH